MILDQVLETLHDGELVSSLPTYVQGLALAGSYARGTAVPGSDLDLFVIFEPSGSAVYRERIEQVLSLLPQPVVRRGPVPVAHFGDSVTLLYQDRTLVQINFNTTDSIEVNPMRRSSRVLFDRSGFYARLIDASHRSATDQRIVYQEYSDWFVIRACYAINSLEKGELMKTTGYLHEMRVALAQIIRLGEGRYDQTRGPYLPLSRFETEVGAAASERLGALMPAYSRDSIEGSLLESVRAFEELQESYGDRFSYDISAVALLRIEVTKWAHL